MSQTETKAHAPFWLITSTVLGSASALGFQALWMRRLSLLFGSTTGACALLLALVMAGLGLGSALCTRIRWRHLTAAYAAVEAVQAILAAFSWWVLGSSSLSYEESGSWAGAGLVALAAAFSGASLPLLVQWLDRGIADLDFSFETLYRLNTLGAAGGVLATTFLLVPSLGLTPSFWIWCLTSLGCAFLALVFGKQPAEGLSVPAPAVSSPIRPGLIVTSLGLGVMSLLLENLWIRSFSLILGSTVYSFGIVLASLLAGFGLGAWVHGFFRNRPKQAAKILVWTLALLGIILPIQLAAFGQLPSAWMSLIQWLPASFWLFQILGLGACVSILLPATLLQGLLFSQLASLPGPKESALSVSGKIYAWNTMGAALGSLAAGFYLIPHFGLQASWMMAALLPLSLSLLWSQELGRRATFGVGAALVLMLLLAGFWRPWNPLLMSSGVSVNGIGEKYLLAPGERYADLEAKRRQLLWYQEGAESVVSVGQTGPATYLQLNGKRDAGTDDEISQRLLAHLPLALHPDPKKVLVIGWGTGCTAATALAYPIERLDCVELEPATVQAASFFSSLNRGALEDGRLRLQIADGRRFLAHSDGGYDAILSQPSSPWMAGVSSLFTLDAWQMARSRLAPGGLFCQWLPYFDLHPGDLEVELRTFARAFPYVTLWISPGSGQEPSVSGALLLVGSNQPQHLRADRLQKLFADQGMAASFSRIGLDSPFSFFLDYLTDQDGIRSLVGAGPLNTDERPLLEFSSPRALYQTPMQTAGFVRSTFGLLQRVATSLPPVEDDPALAQRPDQYPTDVLREAGLDSVKKSLYSRAEPLLSILLKRQQNSAPVWLAWGRVQAYFGRAQEAGADFQRARNLQPGMREAYFAAEELKLFSGDLGGARGVMQDWLERQPEDAEALSALGYVLSRMGDQAGARTVLEKSLTIQPGQFAAENLLHRLGG
jgi:spermidine synthase